MDQLENCQARYRSNTWMGRTRIDGPDEFEPSKFDCIFFHLFYVETYSTVQKLLFDDAATSIRKGVCPFIAYCLTEFKTIFCGLIY